MVKQAAKASSIAEDLDCDLEAGVRDQTRSPKKHVHSDQNKTDS
jgi:hypothetical protein